MNKYVQLHSALIFFYEQTFEVAYWIILIFQSTGRSYNFFMITWIHCDHLFFHRSKSILWLEKRIHLLKTISRSDKMMQFLKKISRNECCLGPNIPNKGHSVRVKCGEGKIMVMETGIYLPRFNDNRPSVWNRMSSFFGSINLTLITVELALQSVVKPWTSVEQ